MGCTTSSMCRKRFPWEDESSEKKSPLSPDNCFRIIVIGPPGSGKGSQCILLAQRWGIKHLDVQQLVKEEIDAQTDTGIKIRNYISDHNATYDMIPDDLVNDVVHWAISSYECDNGFVLEHFPRNSKQAETLVKSLGEKGLEITHVVDLQVPDDALEERLRGRIVNKKTGQIYHTKFNPYEEEIKDKEDWITWSRDCTDDLKKQLSKYKDTNSSIIEIFKARDILYSVDGKPGLKEVFQSVARTIEPKRIILIGPPGSGKGTAAPGLVERCHVKHLSVGDILRQEVALKTDIGKEAEVIMKKGGFVPDEIVNEMVRNALQQPECQGGFILDGYPRTVAQAEYLTKILGKKSITHVVYLEVPVEVLEERICGRRIHKPSGRSYHIKYSPPKEEGKDDVTGEPLVHRADDTAEALKERLKKFYEETKPVVEYFESLGVVKPVDVNKPPKEAAISVQRVVDPSIVLLIGAPASGKGSQAARMVKEYGLRHLSTGDMLRAAVAAGTPAGIKAGEVMKSGGLVNDAMVNDIVEEAFNHPSSASGVIFDGYPRNISQAEALISMLRKSTQRITHLIEIVVPPSILEERVCGRRIHKPSGRSYHIKFAPPKVEGKDDVTGEDLIQRKDDNPDSLADRLKTYAHQTEPVIEYLKPYGIYKAVDGNKPQIEVWMQLKQVLSS